MIETGARVQTGPTYGAPCLDPECGAAACWSNWCRGEGCTCAGCATVGQPDPRAVPCDVRGYHLGAEGWHRGQVCADCGARYGGGQ